jgi:hypothetical protein
MKMTVLLLRHNELVLEIDNGTVPIVVLEASIEILLIQYNPK